MAKIVLDDNSTNFDPLVYNENFRKIENAFNEDVLYRRNPATEPNEMQNDIDMNSNRIYNLPSPSAEHEAARLKDVQEAISGASSANLISFSPYKDITSSNVQGAIQEVRDNIDLVLPQLQEPDGASLIGYGSSTVSEALKERALFVSTISDLKALPSVESSLVFVQGYYEIGDGGGGYYYKDEADFSSPDNGGSTIVANDSRRWKLIHYGTVSVKQFGARGDSITDDEAAIQAAIDIFSTSGGKIWLPPGSYVIAGSGLVLRNEVNGFNGLTLEGAGQGTELKKTTTGNAILSIEGARCTVRGMTFNGNFIAGSLLYLNTLWDGQPTLIENCAFISSVDEGIYCFDGDSFLIRNCYFLGTGQWAINSRNNFMNSSFSANYVQGSGGVKLGSVTQQAEGVRIIDNSLLVSGGSGVGVDVEFGLEIIISNNIIDQTVNSSIRIRNNSSYVKIIDNWLAGGNISSVMQTVAIGQNANCITIIGNTFEGGFQDQLFASATALGDIQNIIIQNNIFNNTAAGRAGIYLVRITRAAISGNSVRGAGSESLYWAEGQHGTIGGNIFWKAPTIGVGADTYSNVGWL